MSIKILGISAFYHDSAAALIVDGNIIAAAQEERFSRIKNDAQFPSKAIHYCLKEEKMTLNEIDYVVFYDKPFVKFERLLETYLSFAPKGFKSFKTSMPLWIKDKLFQKQTIKENLCALSGLPKEALPPLLFSEHHQSHAASAFFPSPFTKAAVLCIDGVGEWATTSIWLGENNQLTPLWEINFPHSLGLLYSAFTAYTGFKVNSGEYKLMGLAPYGEAKYVDLILDNLIDLKADGTFHLNMRYFSYATQLSMTNKHFARLFGMPTYLPDSDLSKHKADVAKSIQVVIEEIILRLVRTIHKELKIDKLCLAGGVALNCVANGRLIRESPFKQLWIQPAAGDAGGALGAALAVWYEYLEQHRKPSKPDAMQGAFLGSRYSNKNVIDYLDSKNIAYQQLEDKQLLPKVAKLIASDNVVGWFQGRMEYGPRALGARSILANPCSSDMQTTINKKIKFRESFRPFAPAIKMNQLSKWFMLDQASPYMLLVALINKDNRIPETKEQKQCFGMEKLKIVRSKIPAVTHVDYSARIQTIHKETNPRFYQLIDEFEKLTDCPMILNTSFNVRDEPIVCTPEDAYRCFIHTDMDFLVLENVIISKEKYSDCPQHLLNESINNNKSKKKQTFNKGQLQLFGLIAGVFILLVFGLLIPWFFHFPQYNGSREIALLILLPALVTPQILSPFYRGWISLSNALNQFNTTLLLALVFFLLITPMGWVMRLFGNDPMQRKIKKNQSSYRKPSTVRNSNHMEKPF